METQVIEPEVITAEQAAKTAADQIVAQAKEAAAVFDEYDQEEVDRIVLNAARIGASHRIDLARLALEETGMGVFEDKVIKNLFATESVYNDIRDLKTVGMVKNRPDLGIMEFAEPIGVILGIIPVTNPTSTTMFKCLISLKTRNPIIISPAHKALKCTIAAARIMYEAALAAGAPEYCIRWIEEPSRELTHALMNHPGVNLILATGGTGMVHAAYASGKPAIGVGPGNVPVYIEKSADLNLAVNDILLSKTFDNGMICASEQAIVVDESIKDEVMHRFREMGGHFLSKKEVQKLSEVVIDSTTHAMKPNCVGQSAQKLAQMAGITIPERTRLLIAPLEGVGHKYPLSHEKLCPVLGFYVAESFDAGVNLCTDLTFQGGLGHSASIFSTDPERINAFSETINAGRILVNSPSAIGGIGDIYNRLHPSLTLGCGSGGCNITTDNVSVPHLINIKRISKRMMNMKWFRVPPKVYFEPGAMDVFFQHEIKEFGARRAFIVCSGSALHHAIPMLEKYLKRLGIGAVVFSNVQSDPTIEVIQEGLEAMKKDQPDLIIAVGGGSPIDAAKAMWLFYEQPELSFDDLRLIFLDIRKRIVKFPALGRKAKFIAIPTTSGTGSEVTAFTVVTDSKTGKKYPIGDYSLVPDVAIVDPNLVMTVPPTTTADTGLDALSHALEAYVSVLASDYTDPLALHAIRLIFKFLPQAYQDGNNALAREKLHNASTIAGMAFTNSFLGINHALAHTLGATFHIAHGRANALVMLPVIRYNASIPSKFAPYPNYPYHVAKERYAEIAVALNLNCQTPEEGVESLIKAIAELKQAVGIPDSIKEMGISESKFEAKIATMAENAFEDQCIVSNPNYPLVEDLARILREAYTGNLVTA